MSFLLLRSFSLRHLTSRSHVWATSFLKVGNPKFLSAHELLTFGEYFMHHFDVISRRHILEHIGLRAGFTLPPYESCTPVHTSFSLLGIVVMQYFGPARASEHENISGSGTKYFNYVLMHFYYKWAYLFEFSTVFGHSKCFLDKMNILHLSMSLTFDLVDFTQLYSTLKLSASGFNYDCEYIIELIDVESDQGIFETAWLSSSQQYTQFSLFLIIHWVAYVRSFYLRKTLM